MNPQHSELTGRRTQRLQPGANNAPAARPLPAGKDGYKSNGKAKPRRDHVLITGGAGFIGTNLASRHLANGERVLIFDNLSRPGVEQNLEWLLRSYGEAVEVRVEDVRDARAVRDAVANASRVHHFAAQVAVTSSLEDPATDFDVNASGTLNVLEAVRRRHTRPPLLFTSTNKVYGNLTGLDLRESSTRYEPSQRRVRKCGVNELQPLDFHSPYGCSKGAADQYVLDYARCFRLPAVVFRMSCIYGPHQFGTEDQGWVAHFLLRALRRQPITIYGDGKQVRDVLFVDDLTSAMRLTLDRIDVTAGRRFNVGGGPRHTTSLLELLRLIEEIQHGPVDVRFEPWRQGDQKYYVSDVQSLGAMGWRPTTSVREGVLALANWLRSHRMPPASTAEAASGLAAASRQRQLSV